MRSVRELPPPVTRSYATAETPVPATHFLSNGRYSVMVTNGGGGYSRCERRRRHALPRGPHARLLGHVLLRARHRQRRGLLGAAQPAPGAARRLPRGLRAGQGRVPPHRRRAGDARRGRGLAGRRRRGPPPDPHQPRPSSRATSTSPPTSRSRSRRRAPTRRTSRSRTCSSRPSGSPRPSAVLFTRRPRSADEPRLWGLHVVACERDAVRHVVRDRPRGVPRQAARRRRPGRARRRRARSAARSGRCSTRAARSGAPSTVPAGESVRLVFSTGVAETPRGRAAPHREVLRRPQRPARHRPRVDGRAARAARPGHQPAGGGHARAARFAAGAHRPVLAAQDQDAGRERPADVGPVVDRHLRRPADPARARRGPRARAARAPGAARAPVLAAQGTRRRPRHPQHAPDRLRRRPRRPPAAARAHRSRAAAARQARRRLPAPRRPDAPRRPQPAALGGARHARGRRGHASSCSSTAEASARLRPIALVATRQSGADAYPRPSSSARS